MIAYIQMLILFVLQPLIVDLCRDRDNHRYDVFTHSDIIQMLCTSYSLCFIYLLYYFRMMLCINCYN